MVARRWNLPRMSCGGSTGFIHTATATEGQRAQPLTSSRVFAGYAAARASCHADSGRTRDGGGCPRGEQVGILRCPRGRRSCMSQGKYRRIGDDGLPWKAPPSSGARFVELFCECGTGFQRSYGSVWCWRPDTDPGNNPPPRAACASDLGTALDGRYFGVGDHRGSINYCYLLGVATGCGSRTLLRRSLDCIFGLRECGNPNAAIVDELCRELGGRFEHVVLHFDDDATLGWELTRAQRRRIWKASSSAGGEPRIMRTSVSRSRDPRFRNCRNRGRDRSFADHSMTFTFGDPRMVSAITSQ